MLELGSIENYPTENNLSDNEAEILKKSKGRNKPKVSA